MSDNYFGVVEVVRVTLGHHGRHIREGEETEPDHRAGPGYPCKSPVFDRHMTVVQHDFVIRGRVIILKIQACDIIFLPLMLTFTETVNIKL